MAKPWENKSGCPDPTAFRAMNPKDEAQRVSVFIEAVRALAYLCGLEILNWVQIRVKKSGNIY